MTLRRTASFCGTTKLRLVSGAPSTLMEAMVGGRSTR